MTRWASIFALAACGHHSSVEPDGAIDPCGGSAACIVTTAGPVQGVVDGALWEWRGIPYAAPPIGDLRWRPPQPVTPWTAPLATTTFGSECMQLDLSTGASAGGSEDCLTLNVWRPATIDHPLPVVFFIHGGYYVQGGADITWHGQLAYDGARIAAQGAIVITAQYRLGALGFLDDPELARSGDAHGNYGTLDQIAALQWLNANAGALGADPSHVMIVGQSAGGLSVCQLLASPLARGLFDAAIIESGATCEAHTTSYASDQASLARTNLGCDGAADVGACMRAVSASAAAGAIPDAVTGPHHWGPTIDGTVELASPIDAFTAGNFNAVPVIVGNTSEEMASQVEYYYATLPTDAASFEAALEKLYTVAHAQQIAAQYPIANYASYAWALTYALTDGLYVCPGRRVARALSAHAPTWRYVFEHAFDASDFGSGTTSLTTYGAYHFIDVPYEFVDTMPDDFTFDPSEAALATQLSAYVVRFAATGDPNDGPLPSWPAFDTSGDIHLALDVPVSSHAGYRTSLCDFWDSLD